MNLADIENKITILPIESNCKRENYINNKKNRCLFLSCFCCICNTELSEIKFINSLMKPEYKMLKLIFNLYNHFDVLRDDEIQYSKKNLITIRDGYINQEITLDEIIFLYENYIRISKYIIKKLKNEFFINTSQLIQRLNQIIENFNADKQEIILMKYSIHSEIALKIT